MGKVVHARTWQVRGKMPKAQRDCLNCLMEELTQFYTGIVRIGAGVIEIPRGVIPVPQKHPGMLLLDLVVASPREWPAILAREILTYLAAAHRAGHPEAAPDALKWCARYRLSVPDWVRDAKPQRKGRGRRRAETQYREFEKGLLRLMAVEVSANALAAERADGRWRRGYDKFDDAQQVLKGSQAHIRDWYYDFKKNHARYYLTPDFLMTIFQQHAPTLHDILS